MKPQSYIFMGRSGCGKGTQADLIMKLLKRINPERDILYLQTGQELREFIKGDTYSQKLTKEVYDKGGLMPEFIAIYAWVKALVEKFNGDEHIVFDGAARKKLEAEMFGSVFEYYKLPKPWVVHVKISKEEAVKRLMARHRFDDKKEEIEERLSWFETDVMQSIEFFQHDARFNFVEVDGERSIEDIHADIVAKTGLR